MLVINTDYFPGNNAVTVKYDSGYSKPLTYGVLIEHSNVTLDGLNFYVNQADRIDRNDSVYKVISVTGYQKAADGNDLQIKNTTIRNCNITFDNEVSGCDVTAVYFDSLTTSGNTVIGGNISANGQMAPFGSVGIHAGAVTLNGITVESNDRALVIECDEGFPNVSVTGDTELIADIAVELRMDKDELSNMPNAFGTVFGGYSNLKYGTAKAFIDRILNTCVTADANITSGVKLRDYSTPLSEVYYKDENGYIWSRCFVANTWVYCNTPVSGNFIAGRTYMLTDANSDTLTTGDTRYVKANGMLSTSFTDMVPLTTTTSTISNHPALNDGVKYKAVGMLPYSGEVKGLVASLSSIPYTVETHLAANGTEYGANDTAKAGNLNGSRNGKVNLAVSGTPDTVILLYLNLNAATLGTMGDSDLTAWQFVDGAETQIDILSVYDIPDNLLAINRQEISVEPVNAVNTFIIKGDDGNAYILTVTVTVV